MKAPSFATRLALVLAALLLAYGALVAALAGRVAAEHEQEALQRLSHGLARHIVGHWPEISVKDRRQAAQAEREKLLSMLMVVNPGIQAYVLDADGRVEAYIGEPGMVRRHQVDLDAVRAFLAGAPLPLRGTDPMGGAQTRIFSAAMFPPRPGDVRPPGYLYIVLDGQARDQVALQLSWRRIWQGGLLAGVLGLLATVLVGVFTFRRLTLPLHRLAQRLRSYRPRLDQADGAHGQGPLPVGDEVRTLAVAFEDLTQRLEHQAQREHAQAHAHREMMAGLAHDLRTPLTALHGHIEALLGPDHPSSSADKPAQPPVSMQAKLLHAALAQSDKVRRLSQQLFELAALQSTREVGHRERFLLDELVTDTVQKFEIAHAMPPVTLGGPPPGALEVEGDLHLIERALTNLIDNAVKHAGGQSAVRVSVSRSDGVAQVWVEDAGPGLPTDVAQRLSLGQSLRDPPLQRAGGGIGGLGLAIAQRVAQLHGGSLRPVSAPEGGTRLCLALPLAA
jgi:signal transduction histidine kinase